MSKTVPEHGDAPRRGGGTVGTSARTIPQVPESAVVRTRLLDRLDRLDPIALIRAPAGTGRSTLAAQWATRQQSLGRPVAWASGDRWGDRQGAAWSAIREALTVTLREADVGVPDHATPEALGAAADAAGKRVMLVVDGADALEDPADVVPVAEMLASSSSLRLLLVTGSRHRLRPGSVAHHPVVTTLNHRTPPLTLTVRDLSFSSGELRDSVRSWGHRLDEAQLAELRSLADGWIGLSRVILDDTRPDDEHLGTAGAYAFLRDVVLPAIADDKLFQKAILVVQAPEPTPETVHLVLETAGRQATDGDEVDLIQRLEAVGVLQRHRTAGGPSRWTTPGLLGEVMRRELPRRDPELAARVHTALARAALNAQPPDARAAVHHAGQAKDWSLLETCWLDFGGYLVVVGGPAVDAVYSAVPDDVVAGSTVLLMARTLARRGGDERVDTRDMVLRLMTELGALALDGRWRSRTAAGRWTGAAAALVAARARGDLRRARVVMRDTEVAAARAGIGGGTSSRSYWWFLVQAGRTALLDDDFGSAIELPTRAYELADPRRAPDVVAAAAAHVALIHSLDGLCTEADRWMDRHVEALDPEWEGHMRDSAADVAEAMLGTDRLDLVATDAALARIEVDLQSPDVTWPFLMYVRARRAVLFGDAQSGLADIEQIERAQHGWLSQAGLVHRMVLRMRAEVLLALGEFHRVADLLEETDPTGVWSDVPRTRWHLLTGDPHTALRTAVLGERRRRVTLADRLDLLTLEAWAAHEAKQPTLAVRAFRSARHLAAEQDTLRPFAHVPATTLEALAAQAGVPFDDDEQARLAGTHQVVPDVGTLVPLTPRERTVLSLLDQYGTTREVADTLTVSVNTVRKQVLSIYSKLGVHDREAALRRAHELGVLGQDAPPY